MSYELPDKFEALNRRQRRKSDQWAYRIQWTIGTLAGICILATVVAQIWMRWHK